MRTDIMNMYAHTVAEVERLLQGPPRVAVNEPAKLRDEYGRYERVGAIWFLPGATGGLSNHGFHVDQHTPTRVRLEAWGSSYRATLNLAGREATTVEFLADHLYAILPSVIRPERRRLVEPEEVEIHIQANDGSERAVRLQEEAWRVITPDPVPELPPVRRQAGGKPHSSGPIMEI